MFTKSFITSVHFKKRGKRVGVLNIEFAPLVNQIIINIQLKLRKSIKSFYKCLPGLLFYVR